MRQVLVTLIFTDKNTEDREVSKDLTGMRDQDWNAKPGMPVQLQSQWA